MASSTEYMRAYRAANKERIKAQRRAYYLSNAEDIRAMARPRAAKWLAENRELARLRCAKWAAENKLRRSEYVRAKREADPQSFRAMKRRDYKASPESYKARAKRWRESKPEQAKHNRKAWVDANRGAVYAAAVKRRADKMQATPSWADLEAIKRVYVWCPRGYHVDHIVPLRGRTVCGLHVHYNLQYLPAKENLCKANKLTE